MQSQLTAPPFVPNEIASFEYPKSNCLNNRRPVYVRRSILVTDVWDMGRRGVAVQTVRLRPMLARGRWLITGTCLDTGQERSFYAESMRDYQRQTWLTLGLFDPLDKSGPILTRGQFAPTATDRRFLARVLDNFNRLPDVQGSGLILGVFPQ